MNCSNSISAQLNPILVITWHSSLFSRACTSMPACLKMNFINSNSNKIKWKWPTSVKASTFSPHSFPFRQPLHRDCLCTPIPTPVNLLCELCCMVWLCGSPWLHSAKVPSTVKSWHSSLSIHKMLVPGFLLTPFSGADVAYLYMTVQYSLYTLSHPWITNDTSSCKQFWDWTTWGVMTRRTSLCMSSTNEFLLVFLNPKLVEYIGALPIYKEAWVNTCIYMYIHIQLF